MKRIATLALALAASALPASAQVLDNFNRPDAGTLGPGWTQVAGSGSIIGNQARGSSTSMAIYNGGGGKAVSFDLFRGVAGVQYGAAIIGYGGSLPNLFVKVQDNGVDGVFDHYAFYTGNNGGGLFATLDSPFDWAHVDVWMTGTVATLFITPNVGATQTYTYDYGFTPDGSDVGLGFFGDARLDNFGAPSSTVPEPSTGALVVAALAGLAFIRRKRAA